MKQPAYHGTGNVNVYDRFRYDLVGGPGGEGAQAYGWGLYFAGNKEVADWYRNKLGGRTILVDGTPLTGNTPEAVAARLVALEGSVDEALLLVKERGDTWRNEQIESLRGKTVKSEGKLYTVDIPEDSEYLDWDKPLEEQSLGVQEKLKSIGKEIWDELDEFSEATSVYRSESSGSSENFLSSETTMAA